MVQNICAIIHAVNPFVADYQMGYRSSPTNCVVRIIPFRGLSAQQEALCLFLREEAGHCWTDMLNAHIESRGGKWLSSVDLSKRFKGQYALHSQTVQALAQKLEANVDAARELRKTDPEARYPHHPKRYQTVVWKESAIHWVEGGQMLLSNGKNNQPLILTTPDEYIGVDIRKAELTWRADHYELCLTIDTGLVNPPSKQTGQVAGVDLGEVNIAAVATEAGNVLLVSGRALRKYVAYKSAEHGMQTGYIPEDYSTRTCSYCKRKRKNAPRGRVYACPRCGAVIHRDANGASNICSRARYGSYGSVQVQTIMYLRPLRRSRAFDMGQRCGAHSAEPHTL